MQHYDNGRSLQELFFNTNTSISGISITTEYIINTNKAHGCDEISVAMLQLCPTEVAIPQNVLILVCFPILGSTPTSILFIYSSERQPPIEIKLQTNFTATYLW